MRCPICSEEVSDTEQAKRWGPEFAHSTCVTAYEAGKKDEREPCRTLVEQCRAALAEELSAWDIDPPLHHVKTAHDACVKWLEA